MRKLKSIRKIKKKNAMQSFEDCRNTVVEPSKAVHSTLKEVEKTGIKVLCFAQKERKRQAEWLGITSWIMGSIANPCINQRNCSGVIERSSSEFRGHEKCPLSTRLYRSRKPSPSQSNPFILEADLPQKRKSVLGTNNLA